MARLIGVRVHDHGSAHRSASTYTYTTELTGAETLAPDRYLVHARLNGNFPGGTVDLRWDFTIENGLIKNLVIAP